ncbi:hypothetical protein BV25DRAFT_1839604 [Artomyces pyxidatus]|uniref:Uncharacterized protein n=1 Tax=Artomyces pyxidatus TaxID=48021 RepID=A0ACB8SVE0_9AGAM|nr:hypothetical protein BV25DRAFT_1839604 [Artomyces pyxidatus]
MSTDEQSPAPAARDAADADAQMQDVPTEPAAMAAASKKRPRLDLTVEPRERKRGKSIFGLVLGTLNKAKNEDKTRNASEAAKKRQLIEQRLQDKLRKETDTVRRAEEAKKDKTSANRKEEDLQLKDSIYKLRRTRLPLLANFLSTADEFPPDDSTPPPTRNPLSTPARAHPPPLYYLPALLLPSQEAFIARRKTEVKEAVEKEWALFREERAAGIEEITVLRQRVAEEEERKRAERAAAAAKDAPPAGDAPERESEPPPPPPPAAEMEVDAPPAPVQEEVRAKDEPAPMQADDDDAVEY